MGGGRLVQADDLDHDIASSSVLRGPDIHGITDFAHGRNCRYAIDGDHHDPEVITSSDGAAALDADATIVQAPATRRRAVDQAPRDHLGRFRSVSISPSVSYAITDVWKAYALVQRPVWQSVNGVGLTAGTAFCR